MAMKCVSRAELETRKHSFANFIALRRTI